MKNLKIGILGTLICEVLLNRILLKIPFYILNKNWVLKFKGIIYKVNENGK